MVVHYSKFRSCGFSAQLLASEHAMTREPLKKLNKTARPLVEYTLLHVFNAYL